MTAMGGFRLFLLLALCGPARAEGGLDALRATMMDLRTNPGTGPRRGNPQMTVAKHQLRDWVEARLKELLRDGDEKVLAEKLNHELSEAGLICGSGTGQAHCPEWDLSSFLSGIGFHWSRGFLILITGIGIECGHDESAYVYSHSDEGWRRVWQTEQKNYTEGKYKPQTIEAVLISPYSKANDYVVLTLGKESWCASNWHDVYYRAFRLGPKPDAPPLVEGAEWAFLNGAHPIQGSVDRNEVLVEFRIGSIDGGVHNRPAIRHHRIDGETVTRTHPLALSPRDFVDEWLTHARKDVVDWSEAPNRRSLMDRHKALHKEFVGGDFIYPTKHCATMPDIWQVGFEFHDSDAPAGTQPKIAYFLVRWRPPYQFSMVEVRDKPSEACTEEDRDADDEVRSLFPDFDWR